MCKTTVRVATTAAVHTQHKVMFMTQEEGTEYWCYDYKMPFAFTDREFVQQVIARFSKLCLPTLRMILQHYILGKITMP